MKLYLIYKAEKGEIPVVLTVPYFSPCYRDEDLVLRLNKDDINDWFGLCERLRSSPLQRVVSRAVYAEEYENSIRDCMGGADGEEVG